MQQQRFWRKNSSSDDERRDYFSLNNRVTHVSGLIIFLFFTFFFNLASWSRNAAKRIYKAIRSSRTKAGHTTEGFKNILAHIKDTGKENDAQRRYIEKIFANSEFEEAINNLHIEEKAGRKKELLEKLSQIFEKESENVETVDDASNKWVHCCLNFSK